MTDLASLGIKVDSSQAKTAAGDLKDLTAAGTAAEASVKAFGNAANKASGDVGNYSQKVLELLKAKGLLTDAAANAVKGIQATGVEAAKTGQAMAGLGIQTSLATREVVTIGRELASGNYTRLAGSVTLLAQAFGLVTGTTLLWAAAAAAVVAPLALVAIEFDQGSEQAAKFSNALQITSNYAGLTQQKFDAMAASLSNNLHVPLGQVEKDLQTLVSSGEFTSQTMQLMANNAILFGQYTGTSSDKAIQAFEKMDQGVTKFALDFEEHYHLLSAAQIDHIQLLEQEGQKAQAEQELQNDLYIALGTKAPAQLGYLAVAWNGVQFAISGALQALRDFGKESTPQLVEQQVAKINSIVAGIGFNNINNPGGNLGPNGAIAQLKSAQEALTKLQGELFAESPAGSQQTQDRQAGVNAAQGAISTLDSIKNSAVLAEEKVRAFNQQLAIALKADPNNPQLIAANANLDEVDNRIRRKYDASAFRKTPKTDAQRYQTSADKVGTEADATLAAAQAYLQGDVTGQQYEARIKALKDATDKKIPSSERDLYIQNSLNLEIAKSVLQTDQHTAKLRDQNTIQETANGFVATGNMTMAQANEYVKEQTALLPAAITLQTAQGKAGQQAAQIAYDAQKQVIEQNYQDDLTKQLQATNAQYSDQIDLLNLEITLTNKDNITRSVAIAQLQEIQRLKATGQDPNSPDGKKAISSAGTAASLNGQLSLTDSLSYQQQSQSMALKAAQDIKFNTDRVARYRAAEAQINVMVKDNLLSFTEGEQAKKTLEIEMQQERVQNLDAALTNIATLTQSSNNTLKGIGKAAAVSQALIDDGLAIMKTYTTTPYPFNIALAAAQAAADAVQISKIISAADGGLIRGAGGPTDDAIPARLSNGEFVVKASATKDNLALLEMINRGMKPAHFASGGTVGNVGSSSGGHVGPYLDFRGANFGGADPDQIEARFRKIIEKDYAPAIAKNAATAAVVATQKIANRQHLNTRAAQRSNF